MADRDHLARIVGSMRRTAIAATPDGGLVTVELEDSDRAVVGVAVLDGGTETAPIAAPYGYASSPGEHGFDIAMARTLAQAMDGELSLDWPPGGGNRLTLHLPRR
jgi:signal transduction histidine kinase